MYQGSELNNLDKQSFLLPHHSTDTLDLLLCKDSKDRTLLLVQARSRHNIGLFLMIHSTVLIKNPNLMESLKAPLHHL
jgi:hypothetical protein